MRRVDLSDWTPEQVDHFERTFQMFLLLKKNNPDGSLALTPDQRDIAVQLGLIPPLSVMIEVEIEGKTYRGLLSLQDDDDIYRGAIFHKEQGHE